MTEKEIRQIVHQKYNGHCAYCGKQISIREMQKDHIVPRYHKQKNKEGKGSDEISNLNPACARCNKWKGIWSIEEFRDVIQKSLDRLDRDAPNFRLAKDYGLVVVTSTKVKFYFEWDII
jgi:5-methylcytosine-specific restriction endonuclease McrA